VKVGDLIKHTPSSGLGLIIESDDCGWTLVKWFDDIGEIEDVDLYEGELEVVSESR
jgi:hypothetical protein